VVLDNGVHLIVRDLVEHLFARNGDSLVYKKLYLPGVEKPLYVVAHRTKGYDEPVMLLTDMMAENFQPALQVRNRFAQLSFSSLLIAESGPKMGHREVFGTYLVQKALTQRSYICYNYEHYCPIIS